MNSQIRNQSQKCATFAYEQVQQYVEKNKNLTEFKSHVKNIPMMIKQNGLAATYAFVFSKADKPDYKEIQTISQSWLTQKELVTKSNDNFHQHLLKMDATTYRRAARELMTLFNWLKRYSDALIKSK